MTFLFLMDPLETVIVSKDTTFSFMLESHNRGHHIYYLANRGISSLNGELKFHVRHVTPQMDEKCPFIRHDEQMLSETEVDAVFIRTNPPFDSQYLMNTWFLDQVKDRVFVMNDPAGIRTVNEKVWAAQFTELVPPTMIACNRNDFRDFLNDYESIIVKPTDGYGGKGIFHLKKGDQNTNVVFEALTEHFTKDIILQKYVPQAVDGDKRILLLNGEPMGAVLRLHGEDDHRNNFFAGGKALPVDITARDKEIVSVLTPHLKRLGLYFVGIDIMGDYLIEVNVTSPTCLQEMNRLYNHNLESDVISFVEKQVEKKTFTQ